jgi:hypothetical protein
VRLTRATVFAVSASAVTLAAIIGGLSIIGSPGDVRMRRLDAQRVSDLQTIASALTNYRRTHDRLPDRLDELVRPGVFPVVPLRDAASGRAYEYTARDASSYELCAVFDTATNERLGTGGNLSPFWNHGRGRHCFVAEARPPTQR